MLLAILHKLFNDPFSRVCAPALLLLLTFSSANSQTTSKTDGSTPLGLSPGAPAGSYPLSGFDSVNPYNGNLNVRLPLVGDGGRGGARTVSVLENDTKSWTVKHSQTTDPITGNPIDIYNPTPNWYSPKPGYGPGTLIGRRSGINPTQTCGFTRNIYQQTLTRLTFTVSDGTEYELRDQLTGGQPAVVSNACAAGASRGTVFITGDGTAATFISDTTISDDPVSGHARLIYPSGYLMLRDGARYRIDSGNVTWMRDRNGNKLSFTYSSAGVTSITDSVNRQVSFTYADYVSTFSDQITFKGFGGATRTILINYVALSSALRTTNPRNEPLSRYQIQTYKNLFPALNGSSTSQYNPWVVASVTLPNNQQYQFFYDCYAEVARINLPTGGAIEYDYTSTDGAITDGFDYQIYRRVKERRVYPNGSTLEGYTTYGDPCATPPCAGNTSINVDHWTASGARLSRETHYFFADAANSLFASTGMSYPNWSDGREYQTDYLNTDGVTVLRSVANTWQQGVIISSWNTSIPNNPRISDSTTTLKDISPNLVSKRTFGYDDSLPYNNQNDVKEYDFGSGVPGPLVRETRTTFITATNYTDAATGAHVRSLPSQVSVYDAGGIERARTSYEYDNYASDTNHAPLTDRPSISGLDAGFTTGYTTRGNATGATRYLLVNGSVTGSVTAYAQYDIAGNVVKAIDARGYATNFDFTDRFGAPDGNARLNSSPLELSSVGQTSYAFATSVTNALSQTAYVQFDYYLGHPVDAEDANGIVASGYYSDALDRPTQIRRAVGNSAASQTTFAYDDIGRTITTTSDRDANNDNLLVSKLLYDGLGRTIETRQYEGGTNYIAVQTQYDAMSRAYRTSNPFRPWQSESAVWATSAFDALSRVTSVTTPDSAAVTTAYSGNQVTVTDQAGKARKSVTDALGRLTTIYEDPSGLNYSTSYSYDVLNDLATVSQGVQTRTFVYDSLKRLTSATNPESGTSSYTYDNNANLLTRTDARGILTTMAYDGLNRPTSKTYTDGTSNIAYFYDSQTLPAGTPTFDRGYSTGALVAVTYGAGSAGTYRGYDALGRILRQYQQTDSINYLVEASYSASMMTSETYPSVPGAADRRTVTYTPDSAGRLASLNSNATTYGPAASVASIGYASSNALSTETYGDSLVHAITYNNRLQPNEIKLGTSVNPTSIVDLTYNYGTTNNNGNVLSTTYTGGGLSYTQTFGYDQLNRLTTSNENAGASWSQTNGYDQYGNRWIDYGGGVHNLSFSTSTNRITTAGFSYDAAGNLTNDTIHAYAHDAEGKIKTVDSITAYTYDGEGHRVRKLVGENTRFIYGISGQLVAEFDGATGNLKKEYVYGGATLITIEPTAVNANGTQYTTSDHLGSPRVITNSAATVVSRHDFMPFGEELGAGVGGRTTAMGFSNSGDNNRKKFTGYERDTETGLDFAQSRYFSSSQGRFTSADSVFGSIANPQSLNRYAYVGNNPLSFSDPTGHTRFDASSNGFSETMGQGGYMSPEDPDFDPSSILGDNARQSMAAWEQRVQNTRDAIAANEALASEDFDTVDALMAANSSLQYGVRAPQEPIPSPQSSPGQIQPCNPGFFNDIAVYRSPSTGREFTGADLNIGGRLVYAESSNNDSERAAVASVVIDRVSDAFPTFNAVAYSGGFQAVTGSELQRQAFNRSATPQNLSAADCRALSSALTVVVQAVWNGPTYPQFHAFRGGRTPLREGMTLIGNSRFAASDAIFNPPRRRR